MVHLKNIGLENFRVFKDQEWFDFAPITILTGTNSSGKSAVINALRLLQDNYRNIKIPDNLKHEEFDLLQLIENDFDSENILERFGNIAQLVNRDNATGTFCFSFKIPGFHHGRFKSDDFFEIRFTITVQENQLRNGKLSRVEIFSLKNNSVVFSLFEKKDNGIYWAARIDLVYYYSVYLDSAKSMVGIYDGVEKIKQLIKDDKTKENTNNIQKELDALNLRYNVSYTIEDINSLIVNHAIDIDASNLKREDLNFFHFKDIIKLHGSKALQTIITKRYKDDEGFFRLTYEILKFLSTIEWNDNERRDQYWNGTDMHFLRWKYVYSNMIAPFSIDYIGNLHEYSQDPIYKVEQFLDKLYLENKASLKDIDFEAVKEFLKCIVTNFKDENSLKATYTHDLFYNTFLYGHLSQILYPFQQLKSISFLSANRTLPKRINSILERDDFSKTAKALFLLNEGKFNEAMNFVNTWVRKFDLGESVRIDKDEDTAQFKFYLVLQNGKETLLADAGFGVLQIMPLILGCFNPAPFTSHWFEDEEVLESENERIIVIEEPETNLHPALQSMLADMFVEAAKKFNTQFIIETHSEYLIRKLQYLTAKTDHNLKPEDTLIYYFHPPGNIPIGEEQVKKININTDGSLTDDFGSGFFDEADKIAISLWNMNKSRKN